MRKWFERLTYNLWAAILTRAIRKLGYKCAVWQHTKDGTIPVVFMFTDEAQLLFASTELLVQTIEVGLEEGLLVSPKEDPFFIPDSLKKRMN